MDPVRIRAFVPSLVGLSIGPGTAEASSEGRGAAPWHSVANTAKAAGSGSPRCGCRKRRWDAPSRALASRRKSSSVACDMQLD